MVQDAFSEVGFSENDDELVLGSTSFSLKKNDTVLISFLRWEKKADGSWNLDAPSPKFITAKVHYVPGVGAIINQGPEWTKLFGKEPSSKVATVIVSWPLDRHNKPDGALISDGKYEVFPWIFSPTKYQELLRKNSVRPFGSHDLQITCTDTKFQTFDYDTLNFSLLRTCMSERPEVFKDVVKKAGIVESKLRDMVGKVVPISELRERLSQNKGGGVGSSAAGGSDVVSMDASEIFSKSIG